MHVRHIPLRFVPMFVQNSENIYLSYYQRIRIERYIYMDNCVIGSRKSSKQQKRASVTVNGHRHGKNESALNKKFISQQLRANECGSAYDCVYACAPTVGRGSGHSLRNRPHNNVVSAIWRFQHSHSCIQAKPSQVKPNVLFTHMQTHLKYVNRFLFSCNRNIPALSCKMQYST